MDKTVATVEPGLVTSWVVDYDGKHRVESRKTRLHVEQPPDADANRNAVRLLIESEDIHFSVELARADSEALIDGLQAVNADEEDENDA